MNTNTLRYVITVAEEGNFTRAAKKLFISQPSLSQNIQALERQLGTELFDRTVTPVQLTYAGKEYVQWARQVLDSESRTLRRIEDIAGSHRRRLVVGVSPYRSLRIMPEVLNRFYRETKGECTVVLVEQRSSEYMKSMEDGKLDLLVDRPSEDESTYESVALGEEQILLAVPERMRLPESMETGITGKMKFGPVAGCQTTETAVTAEAEPIGSAAEMEPIGSNAEKKTDDVRPAASAQNGDLYILTREAPAAAFLNCPAIILPEQQRMGRYWLRLFEHMGARPPVLLECNSIEMALTMTEQGLGMTLVPDTLIRFAPPTPGVVYYTLKDFPMSRTMAVIWSKQRYLSSDARVMIRLLQEVLA